MDPVFAVSLAGTIEKIGAYAGFAAIPGLAVLALLYFSQAREVRRLREWAGRAPERAQELQGRVAEPAAGAAQGRRAGGQPISARPGTAAARAGGSGPPAAAPAQPPRPAPAATGAQAAQPVSPRAAAGSPPPAAGADEPPPAGGSNAVVTPAPAGVAAAGAARVEPDAGAVRDGAENDHRPEGPPAPGVPTPAAGGGATQTGAPVATPLRTARPTATLPRRQPDGGTYAARRLPSQPPEPPGSTGRRRAVAVAAAVALAAAIALAVVVITGTGGGGHSAGAAHAGPARGVSPAGPVVRSRTTVAVLNGTTVPGLASKVATELERGGFRRGSVTNAADQQRPSTTVDYAPGFQRAAREVGTMLRVPHVAPIDAGTQAIAGPQAGVVVTVGTDRTR